MLLVGGLTLMVIKGRAAADAALALLSAVQSDTTAGFPQFMTIWNTSLWPTVGVAGGCVFFVLLVASVRLDQRLRKAGRYRTPKGPFGVFVFRLYLVLAWLGLLLVMLMALWTAVNGILLSTWATQCWNLSQVRHGSGGGGRMGGWVGGWHRWQL